ncbi:MAG TPA: AgmX/PglI C-terminal domain-containing protein [Polyangia bacterium]|nr:AgmX/PglI C-terminal domain-containing protein [Polyangia bacterium]
MKGFLFGLVTGLTLAALGFGGYTYWKQRNALLARAPVVADAGAPTKESKDKKKRRHHGALRLARNDNAAGDPGTLPTIPEDNEPEPMKLSAADLKTVGQGDDLSRPDVVHLDMSDDSGSRELTQDDIDARFNAKQDDILRCIQRARPDEETWVPGRVTVKFRIQRQGTVRGVRVEAPAILQKGGLYGCIKSLVGDLRFPPSNGSQVVTYPFSLT